MTDASRISPARCCCRGDVAMDLLFSHSTCSPLFVMVPPNKKRERAPAGKVVISFIINREVRQVFCAIQGRRTKENQFLPVSWQESTKANVTFCKYEGERGGGGSGGVLHLSSVSRTWSQEVHGRLWAAKSRRSDPIDSRANKRFSRDFAYWHAVMDPPPLHPQLVNPPAGSSSQRATCASQLTCPTQLVH